MALLTGSGERAQADEPSHAKPEEPDSAKAPSPRMSPYEGFAAAPVFLPRSYLYGASPSGGDVAPQPLWFGLEYAFHLPIYNDLRAKAAEGGRWAGAATLSFEGALRMLREISAPVRMPSYRPSISGQVFRLYHLPHPVLWSLKLEVAHHSNGQERCIFDADLRDDTEACRVLTEAIEDPAGALNRISGNFSNTAVGLSFDARAHWLDATGLVVSHLAAGATLAVHLPGGEANLARELRDLYGGGRVSTRAELQHGFAHVVVRTSVEVDHFFGTRGDVPSTAGRILLAALPERTLGFGFFAGYYGGRDFYNAFFVDRIHQFTAGLVWDAERPLRFSPPPPTGR